MSKRAVLYARVSGDDRDNEGRNLASQIEIGREYAARKGYTVIEEIREDDRGASGADVDLPGFKRVQEMARAGEFDVLIARELDRLSRNRVKQWTIEAELKAAGAAIEYALYEYPDTLEGRLLKGIRAEIAEYEREAITLRTVRGRRNKVKAGQVVALGRVAYGYRAGTVDGKSTLTVYEPEARIVRSVFAWYVHGDERGQPATLGTIIRKLEGVPTYADVKGKGKRPEAAGQWSKACVHNMLRNETYAGVWHYGRRNATQSKVNAPEDVLTVDVPSIVGRQLWEAAQERLTYNRETSRRNRRNEYLLAGRVKCGGCNAKMSGIVPHGREGRKTAYYRCGSKAGNSSRPDCGLPHFRADEVDAAVWGWVSSILGDADALEQGLSKLRADQDRATAPLRSRLQIVDDLISENRAQLGRLLDLYLMGDFEKDVLTDRKVRLETTIKALERERAGLAGRIEAIALTPAQIEGLAEFAGAKRAELERIGADFEGKRNMLERIRLQVVLSVEGGKKLAEVSFLVWHETLRIVSNTSYSSCRWHQ